MAELGRADRRPAGAVPPRRRPPSSEPAADRRGCTRSPRGRRAGPGLRGPGRWRRDGGADALVRAGRTGGAGAGGGQPAGQRGEVQPGRRHGRGARCGAAAERARPRSRHPRRGTPVRLRPLLALPVRARALPGSGLGLSIVARSPCGAAAATVDLRPAPGGGTRSPRPPCTAAAGPAATAPPGRSRIPAPASRVRTAAPAEDSPP